MNKDEAMKLALEALEENHEEIVHNWALFEKNKNAIHAIKEALEQPEQKYHRGDRLICLETEEYCVIHISSTDPQWIKFPDSHIGVYTNEQVAELFELLPKELEQEQEPVAWRVWNPDGEKQYAYSENGDGEPLYATPPQRKPLTDEQIDKAMAENKQTLIDAADNYWKMRRAYARIIEAAHGIKEKNT